MPNVVFYIIVIGFASGIFIRSFFTIGTTGIIFILLISVALFWAWRIKNAHLRSPLFFMGLIVCAFALGILRLEVRATTVSELSTRVGEALELSGVIVREPDVRTNSVQLTVRINDTNEKILVFADRFTEFKYGDRIGISGTLTQPEAFQTDVGRTFDYPGYLHARGTFYTVPFAKVAVLEHGAGNPLLTKLFLGKRHFMTALEQVLTEPQAGLGEGLLLGVKRALGEDLEEAFRKTGIIHIVVLSGYNIMIMVVAVTWLLSRFFFPRVRMLVGILFIIAFAILVGLSATVVRASIMAVLVLIARATGRTHTVTRGLMLAGIVMLLFNPYLLAFDPGFALSFLATLGLILLAPHIEERLHLIPTKLGVREFMTATIATQLFVLPFLLYQMGTFSVVSLVVNVLVLPMVPIAMLLTFVTGSIALISPFLGILTGFFAFLSLQYIIVIAEFFAELPFSAVTVPPFPFWVVVIAYAFLALILCGVKEKKIEKIFETIAPTNDYADWIIVEETDKKEPSPEARSVSKDDEKLFPF